MNHVPYIPMLKENNVRKVFFEHAGFLALRDDLPEYLRPFVTFGYRVGWRDQEISSLTCSNVDLKNGIVTLKVWETKNDEARTVYLDDELKALIQHQWESRKLHKKLVPYVFPGKSGSGTIVNFRKEWNNACRMAGFGMVTKSTIVALSTLYSITNKMDKLGFRVAMNRGYIYEQGNFLRYPINPFPFPSTSHSQDRFSLK